MKAFAAMSTTLPSSHAQTEVSLPITGMTCASCVRRVEKAIANVPGVDSVAVNLATERANVNYDPAQTNLKEIAEAVRKSGYDVEIVPPEPVHTPAPAEVNPSEQAGEIAGGKTSESAEAVLPIEGMTCASCVRRVEKSLARVPGVSDAAVNFATEQAVVRFDPDHTSLTDLTAAGERAGYRVGPTGVETAAVPTAPVVSATTDSLTPAEVALEARDQRRDREIADL